MNETPEAKDKSTEAIKGGDAKPSDNAFMAFIRRNSLLVIFVVAFAVIGGIIALVATHAATGPQQLVSGIANKCLDVSGNQRRDGIRVQLWTCNGTTAQKWDIRSDGTIHVNGENGWCLDIKGAGTANESIAQLWTCNKTPAQIWKAGANNSLVYPHGTNKCLDDRYSQEGDGNQVWIWTCNNSNAQKWTPKSGNSVPTPTPTPTPPTNPGANPGGVTPPTPTPTPTPTPSAGAKPVVVGHQLQVSGARYKMKGVAVWGIQDKVTQGFGAGQYANRQKIVDTIKSWGANEVRFRLYSPDYYNQVYMSKAQQIQEIKDWRNVVEGAGMYFHVSWWDSLDGGGSWANNYGSTFQMMTDVYNALGNDPKVFYEPFNEPHDVNNDQWLNAFKATVRHFRVDLGYTGILLADPTIWSHAYDDYSFTQLEQYDASLNGMNGKHQIIFAKHDYANEGFNNPNGGFDSNHWLYNGGNWDFNKHIAWETEFGNYNGDGSTVHPAWSAGAASWMAAKVNDGTLAGATGFLYGPWYDVNAMTGGDNTSPTQWGGYVKNNFLGSIH